MARRNTLQLASFFPYRLSVLNNCVSSAIAAHYATQFALTPPQWRVLAVLGESAPLSAAEVAQRTAMDKVAVSRAVAALLRARRISRAVTPGDRRRSALRLTQAGLQVYAGIVPLALDYEHRLLQTLRPQDKAALDRVLAALHRRARQLDESSDNNDT